MHRPRVIVVTRLFCLFALTGCSGEPGNPVHLVNDRLLAGASELGEEIEKAIRRHVEATHELASCEKHAKNATTQCVEFRISLARAAARLCGLQTQKAFLYKAIENQGDARGVRVNLGESCDLE